MRTVEEIKAEVRRMERDFDLFGVRVDLLVFLPFDEAKEFLKPDADSDGYGKPLDRESVISEMRGYMDFAKEKAEGHRGLSASRSIEHYRCWMWLLGEDHEIDWDNYQNYGAPILKKICERYGFDWPTDGKDPLNRMARGEGCCSDCEDGYGCGR